MPENSPTPPHDPAALTAGPLALLAPDSARALLDQARKVRLKPGDRLLKQGDTPRDLVVVLEGRLKRVAEGDDAAATTVEPHQTIGLDLLLSGSSYAESLVAEQDTTALLVP